MLSPDCLKVDQGQLQLAPEFPDLLQLEHHKQLVKKTLLRIALEIIQSRPQL